MTMKGVIRYFFMIALLFPLLVTSGAGCLIPGACSSKHYKITTIQYTKVTFTTNLFGYTVETFQKTKLEFRKSIASSLSVNVALIKTKSVRTFGFSGHSRKLLQEDNNWGVEVDVEADVPESEDQGTARERVNQLAEQPRTAVKNTPFSDIAEIDPDSLSLESGNTAEAPEQVLQAGAEPPEEALPSGFGPEDVPSMEDITPPEQQFDLGSIVQQENGTGASGTGSSIDADESSNPSSSNNDGPSSVNFGDSLREPTDGDNGNDNDATNNDGNELPNSGVPNFLENNNSNNGPGSGFPGSIEDSINGGQEGPNGLPIGGNFNPGDGQESLPQGLTDGPGIDLPGFSQDQGK